MPTPFTDAPDALLHLWNKFALSGEVGAQNPPATMREAYDREAACTPTHVSGSAR